MRYLLIGLLALPCACKDKRAPGSSSRPAPPPPAPSIPAPADAAPQLAPKMSADPARNLITRASVDGLDAGVVVDLPSLSKRVAPHTAVKAERSVEGEPYPVFEVRDDNKTLLYWVEPGDDGKLYKAVIVSPTLKTPEGIAVGSDYQALKKVVGSMDCGEGDEDMSVFVLCSSERTPELTFLFDAPEDGPPLHERKDPETEAYLGTRKLVRIHWSPAD